MKRFILFIITAFLLAQPVYAAECVDRLDSDGDRCRECALGDFGADALRAYTGADVALFASGDLGITLPAGNIDASAIADSFPADETIVVAEVTAGQLRRLLEESVSRITLGSDERIDETASAYDGFFCVSGFTFSYDASAPVGERMYDFDLADGTYTMAVSAKYAEGDPAGTIRQAVAAYCDELGQVSPPDGGRIRALGANDNPIIGGYLPRSFVIILAVVAIIFGGGRYRRRMNTER